MVFAKFFDDNHLAERKGLGHCGGDGGGHDDDAPLLLPDETYTFGNSW